MFFWSFVVFFCFFYLFLFFFFFLFFFSSSHTFLCYVSNVVKNKESKS